MAYLSADISRCAGRRNLLPNSDVCPVRCQCRRFTEFMAAGGAIPLQTPVVMWMCEPGRDRRIPVKEGELAVDAAASDWGAL